MNDRYADLYPMEKKDNLKDKRVTIFFSNNILDFCSEEF